MSIIQPQLDGHGRRSGPEGQVHDVLDDDDHHHELLHDHPHHRGDLQPAGMEHYCCLWLGNQQSSITICPAQ